MDPDHPDERITKLLAEYKDDPQVAHGYEDDLLWEVVADVAAGHDMRECCQLLLDRLASAQRTQWYS